MELENTSSSTTEATFSQCNRVHLGNIQLLASIDCALALTTLIYNVRQMALVIDEYPKELRLNGEDDGNDEGSHFRVVAAAVASVCLTLTQLLLACLVMVSLSNTEQNRRTVHSSSTVISSVWVLWSAVLVVVLIVYASRIQRFESFGDKFYLFMLISEIVLRVVIIFYASFFFFCRC